MYSNRRGTLTTNIVGGLGNQLFLVANLLATAKRHQYLMPWLPRHNWADSSGEPRPTYWSNLLKDVAIPAELSKEFENTKGQENEIIIPEIRPPEPLQVNRLQTSLIDLRPSASAAASATEILHYRLIGFFQSAEFFSDFPSEQLRAEFAPVEFLSQALQYMENELNPGNALHTCAIHIRRGDYLEMQDVFHILSHSYYFTCMEQLYGAMLTSRKFSLSAPFVKAGTGAGPSHYGSVSGHSPLIRPLIFCEDKEWAKVFRGVIATKYPCTDPIVVDTTAYGRTLTLPSQLPPEALELLLISLCNDVIMANSSFSWWGAFLNEERNARVMAPLKWFRKEPFPTRSHLYCPDWLLV